MPGPMSEAVHDGTTPEDRPHEDGRPLEDWEIEVDRIMNDPGMWGLNLDGDVPEWTIKGSIKRSDGRFDVRMDRRDLPATTPRSRDDRALKSQARLVRELLTRAEWGDAAAALRAVMLVRNHLEALEYEAVVLARAWGWSWTSIGEALGVRGQTIHKRYAVEVPKRHTRRPPR